MSYVYFVWILTTESLDQKAVASSVYSRTVTAIVEERDGISCLVTQRFDLPPFRLFAKRVPDLST